MSGVQANRGIVQKSATRLRSPKRDTKIRHFVRHFTTLSADTFPAITKKKFHKTIQDSKRSKKYRFIKHVCLNFRSAQPSCHTLTKFVYKICSFRHLTFLASITDQRIISYLQRKKKYIKQDVKPRGQQEMQAGYLSFRDCLHFQRSCITCNVNKSILEYRNHLSCKH